mmetsp:Transcript_25110/g.58300  ORF Transcript_25110/g.58300 Transcript_25110/m.58300 type:complete len:103 (+) Transcript_25110:228-536(+)
MVAMELLAEVAKAEDAEQGGPAEQQEEEEEQEEGAQRRASVEEDLRRRTSWRCGAVSHTNWRSQQGARMRSSLRRLCTTATDCSRAVTGDIEQSTLHRQSQV